ncbi:MAG TPA: multiheme c-type cytochrome [Bryobacteraceae bacterium]|nr:multiheme c-type cytochrome [Bryobacteraceae bacterium]
MAAASDYAGSAACAKCHPAEYRQQSRSAHAHSLARSTSAQPGEWAFGAGAQAITFVRRGDPANYIEMGESWYRSINGMAFTPGHRNGRGVPYRIFDPGAAIMRCFACHSTGPLTLADDDSILPDEPGVRCEACHGPAASHALDPARTPMPDPKKLTADDLNRLCGNCHRMPAAAGDATNLQNPWNARHQPLLLAASRCFRESAGRLGCVNCHSPHAPLETRIATYDAVCKTCHAHAAHRTAIASGACVSCHMPRVRPQPNLAFANHRIAVYRPSDPMAPVLNAAR